MASISYQDAVKPRRFVERHEQTSRSADEDKE